MTSRSLARLVVALALFVAAAHADEPPPPPAPAAPSPAPELQRVMESYFAGEKIEGHVFFALGYGALGGGGLLALQNRPFAVGMSVPLLAVGVIEMAAGLWLLLQTDPRVERLGAEIRAAPAAFRQRELARMRGVHRSFRIFKAVEGVLLAVGGVGTIVAGLAHQEALAGAGIGLSLQALAMLILDTAAERRGHRYADRLTAIQIAPPPVGAGLSIGIARRF